MNFEKLFTILFIYEIKKKLWKIYEKRKEPISKSNWDQLTNLLPGDAWYRSTNRTCHENNRFSLFYIRRCESFHEFRRDNLLLLDHVQITLERGFASLVPSDAGHHAGIRAAHIRDHQRVVTRLVHEDLVGQVVGHLLTVYVPCHFGIRTAGHATIKPEIVRAILNFSVSKIVPAKRIIIEERTTYLE